VTKFFLSVHVLAAIIAIGPVAVAASMFPAAVRRAVSDSGDGHDLAVPRMLHRICRVYAVVGIAVPLLGFATAGSLHVMGDTWVIVSIGLTAVAAGVLVVLVLPGQQSVLDGLTEPSPVPSAAPASLPSALSARVPARLAMHAGTFNLLWAVVTVLMILRPGSTTGV
jgi:hypothetical protein